jgi:predicted PurR-regulated permease PerM
MNVTPLPKPRAQSDAPEPPQDLWRLAAQVAVIGLFGMAAITALYLSRSLVMPLAAAFIIGITLSPVVKRLTAYRVPPPVSALALVILVVALAGALVSLFAAPVTEWINRAPEIGAAVKAKLRILDVPLAALRDLKTAVTGLSGGAPTVAVEKDATDILGQVLLVLTPAVSQFLIFFGTLLFFLVSYDYLRQKLIIWFRTRDSRLAMLRIWNDVETSLITYVGMVTLINLGVGTFTAVMLYLVGFPNPLTFGLLAFLLNYVPYIGPGIVVAILTGVGLVASPSLGQALLAPALFVAFATIEGHLVTPSIVGRHLALGALPVFLALAFWTWLWGPIGAFLAVPLLIVSFVVLSHLVPREEATLPG